MPEQSSVSDILLRMQAAKQQGETLPIQDLASSDREVLVQVRREIDAVLMQESQADSRSAQPPAIQRVVPPTRATGPDTEPVEPAPVAVVPGYRIEDVLGRGAMGIVYRAYHLELKRLVALKMILAGAHATTGEVMRFQKEAEAVARLQHPGVVQIHEIGQHEGLPYLSLELVEGGVLSQRLRDGPWKPRESASLVEKLARAMAYCHNRGVLHRDLKPGNVLLTAEGEPKIADFGLAKKLDAQTAHTLSGAILGTPNYMAPEQAEGKKDIGPAADVYALGAILYELLTGRAPFLGATSLDTLLQVRTREPVSVRRLQPSAPRDLETVCHKCLQKDPSRRYGTAERLADDLHRFLAGEPIQARPTGRTERLVRWARRSPWVAGLGAAVLLLAVSLAVGFFIAFVNISAARSEEARARERAQQFALNEQSAREAADREAARARTEALTSQKLAESLAGLFEASDPMGLNVAPNFASHAAGEQMSVKDLLDRGTKRIQVEFRDEPVVLAAQLDAIGSAYRSLGLFDQAEPLLTKAFELRKGSEDLNLAASMHSLAWLYRDRGQYEAAEQLFRKALRLREKLLPPGHILIASTQFHLGWTLGEVSEQVGDTTEAEDLLRKALAVRRKVLGTDHRETVTALIALGGLLLDQQRLLEAAPILFEARQVARKLDGTGRTAEAADLFVQGLIAKQTGQLWLAEPTLRRTLKLTKESLGPYHPYVALAATELAGTLIDRGNLTDAEALLRESLEVVRRTVSLAHPRVLILVRTLEKVLARQGKLDEVDALRREVVETTRRRFGAEHHRTAFALSTYAEFLTTRRHDFSRGSLSWAEADRIFRLGDFEHNPHFAQHLAYWALACARHGQGVEAERRAQEALPLVRKYFQTRWPDEVATPLLALAMARLNQGKYEGVAEFLDEAFTRSRGASNSAERLAEVHRLRGRLHSNQGRPADAERSYTEALTLSRKINRANPAALAADVASLAAALAAQGKEEAAARLRKEAAQLRADAEKRAHR
jgi:tetratricopeptide (TPR) repeat protein